jgi:hypothetical protein
VNPFAPLGAGRYRNHLHGSPIATALITALSTMPETWDGDVSLSTTIDGPLHVGDTDSEQLFQLLGADEVWDVRRDAAERACTALTATVLSSDDLEAVMVASNIARLDLASQLGMFDAPGRLKGRGRLRAQRRHDLLTAIVDLAAEALTGDTSG